MSVILNEDDIKFISNHPIIQYNIGENIKEHIDILIEDFKYIKNDYLEFKNSMPKMLFENVAYKKIFDDNLEKLKTELTAHGEIILTTLVNDKAYQHIADTHLNNLHTTLTESCDSFLKNNSKSIEDIQNNFNNLILDVKNLKNECDNHKKYINNLENIMAINCILLGSIISISSFYGIYKLFY